jgi:hypothetical protein
LLLAGCDRLFFLDRLPDVDIDAAPDGVVADMTVDAPDGVSPLTCPPDFAFVPETQTYYRIVNQSADWQAARASCKGLQTGTGYTHLVVINSDLEYNKVFAMQDVSTMTPWSGAYDPTAFDHLSNFVWVTNETPTVIKWGTGWPDAPDTQHCARIAVPEGMDDETCNEVKWFVCECDRFPDLSP